MYDTSRAHAQQNNMDVHNNSIDKDDFTVVIPVLNEEEGIGKVIYGVKEEGFENILVVDGYSTDKTVSIANTNSVSVIFQHGIGKTGAIRTAIDHVKTPYFVVMDGDCTYDPKDIKHFFPHILKNDEVIGVRTSGRTNIPLLNRFGNWLINVLFNLFFGSNLIDVCSGMYALRMDFMRTLNLETKGFDVEVEIAAKVASKGRITQVPIRYNSRVGRQKLRPFRHGIKIMSTVWNLAKSYNPAFLFSIVTGFSMLAAIISFFWVAIEWFHGIWQSELALFGVLLIIISLISLIMSVLSTVLKRMEQRIIKELKTSQAY